MSTKQVLIWRTDLRNTDGHKVRSGKMAAQLAHASMKVFFDNITYLGKFNLEMATNPYINEWIIGSFVKIVVGVNSENELIDVLANANRAGLPVSLIEDDGRTEFGGIKTYTAGAIGPAKSEEIDVFTKHLKLL